MLSTVTNYAGLRPSFIMLYSLLYAGSLLGEAQSEDRRLLYVRKEYGEKGIPQARHLDCPNYLIVSDHDEIVIDLDKMKR